MSGFLFVLCVLFICVVSLHHGTLDCRFAACLEMVRSVLQCGRPFQHCLGCSKSFHFHLSFRVNLLTSPKSCLGFYRDCLEFLNVLDFFDRIHRQNPLGLVFYLWDDANQFGENTVLTSWSLSVYERAISFHLFKSALISLWLLKIYGL